MRSAVTVGQRGLVHGAVEIVVDALEVAELHRLAFLGEDKDAAVGFAVLLCILKFGYRLLRLVWLIFGLENDAQTRRARGLAERDDVVANLALVDARRPAAKKTGRSSNDIYMSFELRPIFIPSCVPFSFLFIPS